MVFAYRGIHTEYDEKPSTERPAMTRTRKTRPVLETIKTIASFPFIVILLLFDN